MDNLKLLIVEGNTKEENSNFGKAGCVSQSENFSVHIKMYELNCEIDVVEPHNDSSISKIVSSLKKYDGIILTGVHYVYTIIAMKLRSTWNLQEHV